jgi:hypothetical protein
MGEEVRQAIYGMVARCTVGIKFQKVAVFKMRLLHIFSSSFFCQTRRPNPTKKWLLERVKKKLVLILKFFFLKSPFAYWEKLHALGHLDRLLGSWAIGFMGSWVHGFMGSWAHGLLASRTLTLKLTKNACTWALRPSLGLLGSWAHGFMSSWVHGLMGSWSQGL